MKNQNNHLGRDIFKEDIDNSSFVDENITNIPQLAYKGYKKTEFNRIKVFRYIEKNPPVSIYQLHKKLGLAYNTVSYIVRDLIFAGIVSCNMVINEKNIACKMLTVADGAKIKSAFELEKEKGSEKNA